MIAYTLRFSRSVKPNHYRTFGVELINVRERIYPVGRLDKESSGLLLLTNDGILAYRLSHPKFKHEKEYVVSLEKRIAEGALDKLRRGMNIDSFKTQPAKVVKVGEHRFRIVLTEGRNRQIRKMCTKIDNEVVKLKRTRIENIQLGSLKPGEWRTLTNAEKMYHEWSRKYSSDFKLIGAVQGWDPNSYADASERLVNFGFDYIALGGLELAKRRFFMIALSTIRSPG